MSAVCGDCAHCCETAIEAGTLQRGYECRANPPTVAFLPTNGGIAKVAGYAPVTKLHPACGLYEPLNFPPKIVGTQQ